MKTLLEVLVKKNIKPGKKFPLYKTSTKSSEFTYVVVKIDNENDLKLITKDIHDKCINDAIDLAINLINSNGYVFIYPDENQRWGIVILPELMKNSDYVTDINPEDFNLKTWKENKWL